MVLRPDVVDAGSARLIGYGLTTANILYRLPDHPSLLQSFVWQFHDTAPKYPRLEAFLAYWEREIEAAIHSVEIAHRKLVSSRDLRHARFHRVH